MGITIVRPLRIWPNRPEWINAKTLLRPNPRASQASRTPKVSRGTGAGAGVLGRLVGALERITDWAEFARAAIVILTPSPK